MSQQESEDIAATSGPAVTEEWDAAWDSDEQESSDPKTESETIPAVSSKKHDKGNGDDEDAVDEDAWGWGDEPTESTEQPQPEEKQPEVPKSKEQARMHAVTLKENYWTSSMPKPVYDTIVTIYEDGVKLARSEDTPSLLPDLHFHSTV